MNKQLRFSRVFFGVRAVALAGLFSLGACGARAGGGGGAPTPTTDPSTPAMATGCAGVCANARRANCGPFNDDCVSACGRIVAQVPARCSAQMSAYLACASSARVVCASDGPEIQGCDAQDSAVSACTQAPEPSTPDPSTPGDRCLPDDSIPSDIAATLCSSTPATPVAHDCPGGAPSTACVPVPSGEANVFCCPR